jgi:renalase
MEEQQHTHSDVLVVGAGIAGLMAAQTLLDQRVSVTVLERQDHPGGRLATREVGPGRADHGAQFFTARSPEFRAWVDRWLAADLAYAWSTGWSNGSLGSIPPDGHPRYAVRGGMRALADHLAKALPVRYKAALTVITIQDNNWLAVDDKGRLYTASALVLALPVPLALQLLRAGEIPLTPGDQAALGAIRYEPCLAGLFWINGSVRLPEPGAIQRPNAPITWISDNRRKGISPEATVLTIHAGPSYSRELWKLPDWQVLVALQSPLRLYMDYEADMVQLHLERWVHATPATPHPDRYLVAADLPPLVFAGDAFGVTTIEGAALSGLAAGALLASR